MSTITITNPTRSQKWGYGWSTQPERNSTAIVPPTAPDYAGTIDSVQRKVKADRTFTSVKSGGTFYNTRWFYAGKEIVGVSGDNSPDAFASWLFELDYLRDAKKAISPVTLILKEE
jgi:hypothetical protein